MNIMFFCIPAHGHHNPTFPVAAELIKRGNNVRYYSFAEFEEKIRRTGAEFVPCDKFLPPLSDEEMSALKEVSVTEMTITDLRTTMAMDDFLGKEVAAFKPDVIVSDLVCFWGKLTSRKYKIPLVVSTTTFAFNKYSSGYMKSSPGEILDLIRGNKRAKEELKKLNSLGYSEKSIMSLVQSDNYTDTIVYATKKYQPVAESFSKHYAFVGPSVFSEMKPQKDKEKPLVYISMGTVVNDRPDFYTHCIEALKTEPVDVIISCGKTVDISSFGELPDNIKIQPYVNQLEVLSRADVFVTHCGMNSVSESLYMATPMVLFPQTNEQRAVARRAAEVGAGIMLKKGTTDDIKNTVLSVLKEKSYSENANACSEDFRNAPGAKGAADFIENAPHLMHDEDKKNIMREFLHGILQLAYWAIAIACIIIVPRYIPQIKWWVTVIIANVMFGFFRKFTDKMGFPKQE